MIRLFLNTLGLVAGSFLQTVPTAPQQEKQIVTPTEVVNASALELVELASSDEADSEEPARISLTLLKPTTRAGRLFRTYARGHKSMVLRMDSPRGPEYDEYYWTRLSDLKENQKIATKIDKMVRDKKTPHESVAAVMVIEENPKLAQQFLDEFKLKKGDSAKLTDDELIVWLQYFPPAVHHAQSPPSSLTSSTTRVLIVYAHGFRQQIVQPGFERTSEDVKLGNSLYFNEDARQIITEKMLSGVHGVPVDIISPLFDGENPYNGANSQSFGTVIYQQIKSYLENPEHHGVLLHGIAYSMGGPSLITAIRLLDEDPTTKGKVELGQLVACNCPFMNIVSSGVVSAPILLGGTTPSMNHADIDYIFKWSSVTLFAAVSPEQLDAFTSATSRRERVNLLRSMDDGLVPTWSSLALPITHIRHLTTYAEPRDLHKFNEV